MKLLTALLLILPLIVLSAERDIDDSTRREVRAKMEAAKLKRLKGWKRIVFLCSPSEKTRSRDMFDRICERTNTNVKFLAASAKVQVQVAPDAYELGFLSGLRGMLRLEVELFSSACDTSACAIHATVVARFPYDKAIDQAARSYPIREEDRRGPKDSPASIPRPIEALMWGPRHLTASGYPGEELASGVSNGVDTLLKEFFTDYIQANRGN
jgi:hypothetical protein